MATHPRHIRADDVPGIPVTDPGLVGYELIDGELVPVMGANVPHAWSMARITHRLTEYAVSRGSGDVMTDVWWRMHLPHDPERLHAPDIAYVVEGRLRSGDDDVLRIPPDLIVEVYSATNNRKRGDFQRRIRDYLDGGARLLWVIYPEARYAMVHRADGSAHMVRETDALDGEDILPGFSVPVGELLRPVP